MKSLIFNSWAMARILRADHPKRETRRPIILPRSVAEQIEPPDHWMPYQPYPGEIRREWIWKVLHWTNDHAEMLPLKPPLERHDICYVRETWAALFEQEDGTVLMWRDTPKERRQRRYCTALWYKADADEGLDDGSDMDGCWVPPIHMPEWASRAYIEITDIKAHRLWDTPLAGLLAEGITPKGIDYDDPLPSSAKAYCLWRELWDDLYADRGLAYKENPWVWAYRFDLSELRTGYVMGCLDRARQLIESAMLVLHESTSQEAMDLAALKLQQARRWRERAQLLEVTHDDPEG